MNRISPTRKLVSGTVLTLFLTAAPPGLAEGPVVGVFLPLSGQNAVTGHIQKNAMLLALDHVNHDAVPGEDRILELDIRDARDRPKDARNLVRHFITDKQYPLIIGGGVSAVVWEAARRCERERTPLIAITGSEDRITSEGFGYVFRIAPPRSLYWSAPVGFTRDVLRPEKIGLITEISGFGDSMAAGIRAAAEKEGWKVSFDGRYPIQSGNLNGIIESVRSSGADAVFLTSFPPESGMIMQQIRRALPEAAIVNLVPSSFAKGIFLSCGDECGGVYSSALWWEGGSNSASAFKERYLERFGMEPDYHGAQAYAAVIAASLALSGADPGNREEVFRSIKATRTRSPMGVVSFEEWGKFRNQNRPPTYLFQWFGDRFEVIWPEGLRTAEPIRY
jgi:branched-chain amino acid transport system substrate-binding protein